MEKESGIANSSLPLSLVKRGHHHSAQRTLASPQAVYNSTLLSQHRIVERGFLPDLDYHRQRCLQSQSQSRPDLSVSLHSPYLVTQLACQPPLCRLNVWGQLFATTQQVRAAVLPHKGSTEHARSLFTSYVLNPEDINTRKIKFPLRSHACLIIFKGRSEEEYLGSTT